MAKRKKLNRSKSKKMFTNTAKGTHPVNTWAQPMRGGIRL